MNTHFMLVHDAQEKSHRLWILNRAEPLSTARYDFYIAVSRATDKKPDTWTYDDVQREMEKMGWMVFRPLVEQVKV